MLRLKLFSSALVALSVLTFNSSRCAAAPVYSGVNLAGAELAPGPTARHVQQALYLPHRPAEVDYFVGKGVNTFRLPFLWERFQPTLDAGFNPAEFARVDGFVRSTRPREKALTSCSTRTTTPATAAPSSAPAP